MSRCFPFPPPGYEKKARPEDANILTEGKHKGKKPKKGKKNREKTEGKEKRDKERSDEKHRDKRERKEKHKDKEDKHREKKKETDEDKSKDKEKSSTSEASKVTGLPKARSGEKLNRKDGKDIGYCSDERNRGANIHGQNGAKPAQSNFLAKETEESKIVQELGWRIRDEKTASYQSVDRFSDSEKKWDGETQRPVVGNTGDLVKDKGKNRDERFDNKKMGVQGIREEARFSGDPMVQNLAGTAKGKVQGLARVVENIDERKMEGKEREKEKEFKQPDKHKTKDRDKKGHGKEKDREKERKKEEKSNEKNEPDKSVDVNRSGLIGVIDKKNSNLSSNHNNNARVDGNFKKRKDRDINGFLHDNETRPNKLLRPASQPMMENGRKLEVCQAPRLSGSEKQGIAHLRLDTKERKNGIIELQSLPTSIREAKPKSQPVTADTDGIVEVSHKPPHPDSKYLSQVLSVPKMDEWSEFHDQEWLFCHQDPSSRKNELGSRGFGEERQVWCEALNIESADVVALPYVVPY